MYIYTTFSGFKDLKIVGGFSHSLRNTWGLPGLHGPQMHWGCLSHIDQAITYLDFAIPN